jgi:hypothetical protein
VKTIIKCLASLRLTIALLVLTLVLILVATFAQVDSGIFFVKARYFDTLFVTWTIPGTSVQVPIFPGGFAIGGLLLFNLLAAHLVRLQWGWRKLGIQLTHLGLILLVVGMFVSAIMQIESHLEVSEGESRNYSEDSKEMELAVISSVDAQVDEVVAIPQSILAREGVITVPQLPFTLRIHTYLPNSRLFMRDAKTTEPSPANQGIGAQIRFVPEAPTKRDNEINFVTVVAEVLTPDRSFGTWLLSNGLGQPQFVTVGGQSYQLVLRPKRYYTPYTLTLLDFAHDKYAGTEIPKNFSSLVTLSDPSAGPNRDFLIYMNHPLRHGGKTYYQAAFKNNDTTTILQVVDNPGWLLPYISCAIIAFGLLYQFLLSLSRFLKRPVNEVAP